VNLLGVVSVYLEKILGQVKPREDRTERAKRRNWEEISKVSAVVPSKSPNVLVEIVLVEILPWVLRSCDGEGVC
jgi:hypothetical protein